MGRLECALFCAQIFFKFGGGDEGNRVDTSVIKWGGAGEEIGELMEKTETETGLLRCGGMKDGEGGMGGLVLVWKCGQ
jgi:hypothetical protein